MSVKRACNKCFRVEPSSPALCDKLQFCAGCKAVAYCNDACQRADWGNHKEMCAEMKGLRAKFTSAGERQEGTRSHTENAHAVFKRYKSIPAQAWPYRYHR